MDRRIQFFQINSGDFSINAGDTANDYSNQLPNTIVLDKNTDYEVCMYDVMFQNDQNIQNANGFPLRNVDINTDLVESVQVGSDTNNVIYTVNWTKIVNNSYPFPNQSFGANSSVFIRTFGNRMYFPLKKKTLFKISVWLTYSDTGDNININPDPSAFTSVTFAIRQVNS